MVYYSTLERILWIQNTDFFFLEDYIHKYEISLRTARRDIEFCRSRLNINIVFNNKYNRYEVQKMKQFIEEERKVMTEDEMKCCENCRHWIDSDCVLEHDYDCKRWNNRNTDDYWECVE